MTNEPPEPFIDKAKRLVVKHENKRIQHSELGELTEDQVFVVWSVKALQNWKAVLGTVRQDNMLYEATYDGDKETTYVDSYRKWENSAYPDKEN